MADVFISYARSDRGLAADLARALRERGWSVWWDRQILPGATFDEIVERELGAASAVIVLWTERSVSSRWVRAEASDGLERGVLVPVVVDPTTIPLEFRLVQAADLTGWRPGLPHRGFEDLVAGVAGLARRTPTAAVMSDDDAVDMRSARRRRSARVSVVGAGLLVLVVGAVGLLRLLGGATTDASPAVVRPLPAFEADGSLAEWDDVEERPLGYRYFDEVTPTDVPPRGSWVKLAWRSSTGGLGAALFVAASVRDTDLVRSDNDRLALWTGDQTVVKIAALAPDLQSDDYPDGRMLVRLAHDNGGEDLAASAVIVQRDAEFSLDPVATEVLRGNSASTADASGYVVEAEIELTDEVEAALAPGEPGVVALEVSVTSSTRDGFAPIVLSTGSAARSRQGPVCWNRVAFGRSADSTLSVDASAFIDQIPRTGCEDTGELVQE